MKLQNKLNTTLALLSLTSVSAFSLNQVHKNSRFETVTVPLVKAFIPRVGFDDNDNIQVVLNGYLPNRCFTVAEPAVIRTPNGDSIQVKQLATKQKEGICANQAALPPDMKVPVPFTTIASIGQLNPGQYNVQFDGMTGISARHFVVARASLPSVDNMNYALVNNIFVPEQSKAGEPVVAILSGHLNSSCTKLAGIPVPRKVDDVIVLLPQVKVSGGYCLQVLTPFTIKVNLGALSADRYLLHVRSMSGVSVNQVFQTINPQR